MSARQASSPAPSYRATPQIDEIAEFRAPSLRLPFERLRLCSKSARSIPDMH